MAFLHHAYLVLGIPYLILGTFRAYILGQEALKLLFSLMSLAFVSDHLPLEKVRLSVHGVVTLL